ncbi:hypothetical protein DUHN57_15760 [Helicobacter pylori]|nr:hypothetical protein VN0338_15390 [Helicobacter pylori]
MKQKLTDKGFVGNGDKALFSVLDWINEKKGISSVRVKLQKNRLYLVNNVKHNYTAIDLFKVNYPTAKAIGLFLASSLHN